MLNIIFLLADGGWPVHGAYAKDWKDNLGAHVGQTIAMDFHNEIGPFDLAVAVAQAASGFNLDCGGVQTIALAEGTCASAFSTILRSIDLKPDKGVGVPGDCWRYLSGAIERALESACVGAVVLPDYQGTISASSSKAPLSLIGDGDASDCGGRLRQINSRAKIVFSRGRLGSLIVGSLAPLLTRRLLSLEAQSMNLGQQSIETIGGGFGM